MLDAPARVKVVLISNKPLATEKHAVEAAALLACEPTEKGTELSKGVGEEMTLLNESRRITQATCRVPATTVVGPATKEERVLSGRPGRTVTLKGPAESKTAWVAARITRAVTRRVEVSLRENEIKTRAPSPASTPEKETGLWPTLRRT